MVVCAESWIFKKASSDVAPQQSTGIGSLVDGSSTIQSCSLCARLSVSRSKYCAWRDLGRESNRTRSDYRVLMMVRSLHQEWDGFLGHRQIDFCSRRAAGNMCIRKKRRRQWRPGRIGLNIPDLLPRDFSATEPKRVWISDITELTTGQGTLY